MTIGFLLRIFFGALFWALLAIPGAILLAVGTVLAVGADYIDRRWCR